MTKHNDGFFLLHVVGALSDIVAYTSVGKAVFYAEKMRQDAVERKFEILGEAVKNLSFELREKYSHIKWTYMARFRDILSHHYFGIDLETVWSISQTDVKEALSQMVLLEEYMEAVNFFEKERVNTLDILLQNRDKIHQTIEEYGIPEIFTFGPIALRKEAPDCDIELFCYAPCEFSNSDCVNLQNKLMEVLRCRVKISTSESQEFKETPEHFHNLTKI